MEQTLGNEKNLPQIYVCSIEELFLLGELKNKESQEEKSLKIEKLEIPDYQRPYDWEREQVEAFLEDLLNAFQENKKQYLIGNMIFYKTLKNSTLTYEIVDGQQRLITLGLILYFLKNCSENEENCKDIESLLELELSHQSVRRILENYRLIENKLKNFEKKDEFFEFLKRKVIISITITEDLDQAFFLFDSQNTRGKPLERKDLLKVHHLRLIKDEKKRKFWAKEWEKWERDYENEDKLKEILEFMAITRKAIRGELSPEDMVEVDVYKEFLSEEEGEYELNNYNQPPIFKSFQYLAEQDELYLISKELKFKFPNCSISEGWKFLPFQITQSIIGGEQFFYFVKKYFNLVKELEKEEKVGKLFILFSYLRGSGNFYINRIYQPVLLFFYDKFGKKEFEEFALRIIIILSYYRLRSTSVRKEGVIKYEWAEGAPLDFFKLIFLKSSSSLIIKELDKYIQYEIGDTIGDKKINIFAEDIEKEIGHQKRIFIEAWKREEQFRNRIQEILEKLGRNWK